MALSCQPNDLASAAKCFYCLPNQTLSEVQTLLLAQIASQSTNSNTLALAAKAFTTLNPSTLLEVQVYLLALIAKSSTDPSTLAQLAKCFECLNPNLLYQVETYLLAVKAGGSTDPNTLASQSRSFMSQNPTTLLEIQTYLLALIAGQSTDPSTLARAAKCFFCLPGIILREVKTYLLCQYVNSGGWFLFTTPLVPNNSTVTNFNHGLPGTPQIVYPVFVNQVAEANYTPGDEIPAYMVWLFNSPFPAGGCLAGPTRVEVQFYASSPLTIWNKTTQGVLATMTTANWMLKAYCLFFGTGGPLSPKPFSSGQFAPDGAFHAFNHGLSSTPMVIGYIDCIANDAGSGMVAGQTIRAEVPTTTHESVLYGANATQIYMHAQFWRPGAEAGIAMWSSSAADTITSPTSVNNFQLRLFSWTFQ